MIKCLVSDVDGTLLLHGSFLQVKINDKTIKAIKYLKESGIHFVIATGRTHATKEIFEKQFGFPLDFIGSNGASVVVNEKLIVDKTMPWDVFERLTEQVRNQHIEANILFVDSDGHHIMDKTSGWNDDTFLQMYHSKEIGHYFEGSIHDWREHYPRSKKFNKAVVAVKNLSDRDKVAESLKTFVKEENCDMYFSASVFVEIMPQNVNKASGIKAMSGMLGFQEHEIAVVGDSYNDVFMFEQYHQHSFVMKSAEEDVLKKARYVVSNVDEVIAKVFEINQRELLDDYR